MSPRSVAPHAAGLDSPLRRRRASVAPAGSRVPHRGRDAARGGNGRGRAWLEIECQSIGHRPLHGRRAAEIAKHTAMSPTSAPPPMSAACASPRSGIATAATTARQQAQAITANSIVWRVSLRALRCTGAPDVWVSLLVQRQRANGQMENLRTRFTELVKLAETASVFRFHRIPVTSSQGLRSDAPWQRCRQQNTERHRDENPPTPHWSPRHPARHRLRVGDVGPDQDRPWRSPSGRSSGWR